MPYAAVRHSRGTVPSQRGSGAHGSSSGRLLTLRSVGVIQYLPGTDKKVAENTRNLAERVKDMFRNHKFYHNAIFMQMSARGWARSAIRHREKWNSPKLLHIRERGLQFGFPVCLLFKWIT